MVVVPREPPLYRNLNSYYVDIPRCIEHFQGEFGAGCLHLRSPSRESVLFFDKDQVLNGVFREKRRETTGAQVLESVVEAASERDFAIDIYRIDEEEIYFWSSIPEAEPLYRDLSAEFTNLDALIKKMFSEKLTGYIDIAIGDGRENSILYFNNGTLAGGSHSWPEPGEAEGERLLRLLIQKTRSGGGVFHVYRIPPPGQAATGKEAGGPEAAPVDLIPMLESLLAAMDRNAASLRKAVGGFDTLLKRKFIEKADDYAFLDPFAAEFTYKNDKISYRGKAGYAELAEGVLASVREIVEDLGSPPQLSAILDRWTRKHAEDLEALGIHR